MDPEQSREQLRRGQEGRSRERGAGQDPARGIGVGATKEVRRRLGSRPRTATNCAGENFGEGKGAP